MKYKPAKIFYRDVFNKDKFPQLYSKRGFEKNRIKIVISSDPHILMMFEDIYGNLLDVEL